MRFDFSRRTKTGAPANGLGQSRHHALIRMPHNQRPIAAHIIDIIVPIDIRNMAAFPRLDEQRRSTNGLERTHR